MEEVFLIVRKRGGVLVLRSASGWLSNFPFGNILQLGVTAVILSGNWNNRDVQFLQPLFKICFFFLKIKNVSVVAEHFILQLKYFLFQLLDLSSSDE